MTDEKMPEFVVNRENLGCPFCPSLEIEFEECPATGWGAAVCGKCDCSGPAVKTYGEGWKIEALKLWNTRAALEAKGVERIENAKFVGKVGSPFLQYNERTFVSLENGVHEMIDGIPVLVQPAPVGEIEGLEEAIDAWKLWLDRPAYVFNGIDLKLASHKDKINQALNACRYTAGQKAVYVKKLRQCAEPVGDKYYDGRIAGWNDCLDHLVAQGILKTGGE